MQFNAFELASLNDEETVQAAIRASSAASSKAKPSRASSKHPKRLRKASAGVEAVDDTARGDFDEEQEPFTRLPKSTPANKVLITAMGDFQKQKSYKSFHKAISNYYGRIFGSFNTVHPHEFPTPRFGSHVVRRLLQESYFEVIFF